MVLWTHFKHIHVIKTRKNYVIAFQSPGFRNLKIRKGFIISFRHIIIPKARKHSVNVLKSPIFIILNI